MAPSASVGAGAAIGIPLATIISWVLNTFFHVEVPGPVEAAFGASLTALIGYVFHIGKQNQLESTNEGP
jgi:hypothetical protein